MASLFGWANRTLESTADPLDVPWAWRVYAYRGYLLLQTLDRSLLEPRLPAALFYNLLVSARAPAPSASQPSATASNGAAAGGDERVVEGAGTEGKRRLRGRGLEGGRLRDHPGQHGVEELARPLGRLAESRGERSRGLREAALGCDAVEHRGGLRRRRKRAEPVEHAPRHLAQPGRAGGRSQPGGG